MLWRGPVVHKQNGRDPQKETHVPKAKKNIGRCLAKEMLNLSFKRFSPQPAFESHGTSTWIYRVNHPIWQINSWVSSLKQAITRPFFHLYPRGVAFCPLCHFGITANTLHPKSKTSLLHGYGVLCSFTGKLLSLRHKLNLTSSYSFKPNEKWMCKIWKNGAPAFGKEHAAFISP